MYIDLPTIRFIHFQSTRCKMQALEAEALASTLTGALKPMSPLFDGEAPEERAVGLVDGTTVCCVWIERGGEGGDGWGCRNDGGLLGLCVDWGEGGCVCGGVVELSFG